MTKNRAIGARWFDGESTHRVYSGRTPLIEVGASSDRKGERCFELACVILDAGCHVIHANPHAERLVNLDRWGALPGRRGPHLMQLMTSDAFLEQVRNWDTVAGVILPGRLEPLVLGADGQSSSLSLRSLGEQLRKTHAPGLARLAEVGAAPVSAACAASGVRFEWTSEEGEASPSTASFRLGPTTP